VADGEKMIIGHRGVMGLEPENTLRSFKRAIKMKLEMVELDVHVCKSGELIVIHDATVDRTTDGKGRVSRLTLSQLKKLNAGKGEKIPTLNEVLDLCKNKIKVNIEIKGGAIVKPLASLLNKSIRNGWGRKDLLVSSFDNSSLRKFSRLCKVQIGILITKPIELNKVRNMNPYSINVAKTNLTKKFIDTTHKQRIKVFVWTVDNKKTAQKFKRWGVDGIFTNYPNKL
jgi:glycerophosphoryl diester phosphodiesterase